MAKKIDHEKHQTPTETKRALLEAWFKHGGHSRKRSASTGESEAAATASAGLTKHELRIVGKVRAETRVKKLELFRRAEEHRASEGAQSPTRRQLEAELLRLGYHVREEPTDHGSYWHYELPSSLSGAARTLDLWVTYDHPLPYSESQKGHDQELLKDDFRAVAEDFAAATDEIAGLS